MQRSSHVSGHFLPHWTVERLDFQEIIRERLYRFGNEHLVSVMRETTHYFEGRGNGTGSHLEPYCFIRCDEGTVMAIIIACHGVEFILGYCRNALYDKWGLYCGDVFIRHSDAAITRSWAVAMKKGLSLFRPTRLEFVTEQEWMKRSR